MKMVRNVSPNSDYRGQNVFLIRGRNVFPKVEEEVIPLSEIWFGCETSFSNMAWVRNVFLNYEDGGETSFLFMGRGRNVFPKYELGAKRLTKKWCELTMGRKVCVPYVVVSDIVLKNKQK